MTPTEGPSPTGGDAGPAPQPGSGAEPVAEGWSADEEAAAGEGAVEDASGEDLPAGGRRGDTVAAVVRQWQAVHPGLDTGPMEIIGRINRCAALLQQAEDAPLRRAGLSRPEFDLLGALRRTGHELTPGDLARETFSSGAAVTKRLKQLTERGLVERRGDTRDRRVVHLRLTDAGRDLVDAILPVQLAYETAVLSGVDGPEQGELAALLGELLGQLEGRLGVLRA
ncbi:MarR family transcriptional regulator [Streptomyces sp. NPDC029044]|uniref:MarR family winged helix-turn-helix transcriptional regulator n=1 Tax=Streptomyces sp. NPDC029044 TaxID=3157198 RepID=UPI0033E1EE97